MLPLAVTLPTIPIYIHLIGNARYGILALVWSFLGYFNVFDLGLGRATAQRIAALGNSPPRDVAAAFWTAVIVNGAIGICGGLLIWPLTHFFFVNVATISDELKSELTSALPWLILAVPLMTLSGVFAGALQGRARFLELNVISVAGSILFQIIPLITAWMHGADLAWLLPAVVLSRLLSFAAMFWRCQIHVCHWCKPSFSRAHAGGLLAFGGWVTITSLVSPLMVILDRFVIGAFLGAQAVTYYTVPFTFAERSTVLASALTSALFPRFAVADHAEGRQLGMRAISMLAAAMTPIYLISVLLVEPFFQLWIGSEFALGANITAQFLLIGFCFYGFSFVPYVMVQARGRPDVIAKFNLLELIPYLCLLFLGLGVWGLPGAAFAYGIRTSADCIMLMFFAGILPQSAELLRMPLVLLLAAIAVAFTMNAGSTTWFLTSGGLLLVTLVWSWRIMVNSGLRDKTTMMISGQLLQDIRSSLTRVVHPLLKKR